VWTGLIWCRIGSSDRLLWTRQYSQERSSGLYSEPDESSPYHAIFKINFNISSHLHLGLPSGFFTSGLGMYHISSECHMSRCWWQLAVLDDEKCAVLGTVCGCAGVRVCLPSLHLSSHFPPPTLSFGTMCYGRFLHDRFSARECIVRETATLRVLILVTLRAVT
jgi:hypothetical protein